MKFIKIDKNDWAKGIQASKEQYQVFGPVKNKNSHLIQKLDVDELPDMEYTDSLLSPKSVIFPQTEKILFATLDESQDDHHIMKRTETDYSHRAVVGIRPYDAKAIQLVKLNFDTDDYRDPYWCDAYEATTFIGLGINNPGPFDFSTSTGTGPFCEEGLDILLADLGDSFLGKVLTPKGEDYANACGFSDAFDEAEGNAAFEKMSKAAEEAVSSSVQIDKLQEKTILDLHEAPFWDDVAFSCINCGTCTYVCPTCWCFDIQDETKGKSSVRMRNWDTCMSDLFTRHASGHNPREKATQRLRQRFMHKLKYFLDKYDQGIMCVGCGRCVKHCPVNIDIREVSNIMNAYEKQKA